MMQRRAGEAIPSAAGEQSRGVMQAGGATPIAREAAAYVEAGEIPHTLMCPITRDVFDDPVYLQGGSTYSRAAITRWLSSGRCDPRTNLPIRSSRLTSNHAAHSHVEQFWSEVVRLRGESGEAQQAARSIQRAFRASRPHVQAREAMAAASQRRYVEDGLQPLHGLDERLDVLAEHLRRLDEPLAAMDRWIAAVHAATVCSFSVCAGAAVAWWTPGDAFGAGIPSLPAFCGVSAGVGTALYCWAVPVTRGPPARRAIVVLMSYALICAGMLPLMLRAHDEMTASPPRA